MGLLGRMRSSSAFVARTASSSSPVEGFAPWPPRTMRKAPYSRNAAAVSVSTAPRPSEGATAMTPSGNRVAGSGPASIASRSKAAATAGPAGSGSSMPEAWCPAPPTTPPTNATAFASRTSCAWSSRFSIVILDSVPTDKPYAITASGRSLWTCTLAARRRRRRAPNRRSISRCAWIAPTSTGAPAAYGRSRTVSYPNAPSSAPGAATAHGLTGSPTATATGSRSPIGRPRAAARAPWNSRYRPWPPESTTCASRRIGSSDGVRGDRSLGRLDRRDEHRLDVVVALRSGHGGRGRLADDGQDGPLDRFRHRLVGHPGARVERVGQVEPVEPPLAGEPVGHAGQDLAGDHPGVAARTHEGPEADRLRHPFRVGAGTDLVGLVERGLHRREHVGAGVAIGDREHVERVDLVDARLEAGHGAPERGHEPRAVAGPPRHQATSVPLSARSDGRDLVRRRVRPGGDPVLRRRRPMRIETRSGSRPSARASV